MKRVVRETEYLSLLRFLAILFIVWAHYEYQVYALYAGTNVEMRYFFPPAKTAWIFYGWTGKYALSMLCVVSGYLCMLQCEKGKNDSFFSFAWKRYLRLLLPITGTGILYMILDGFTNRSFGMKEYLSGLFVLGSSAFDQHVYAIWYFYLGNVLIVGIYLLCKKKGVLSFWLQLFLAVGLLFAVLKRWRFLDSLSHDQIMRYQLLLRIYHENWTWVAATLLGAATYLGNVWVEKRMAKRYTWIWLILLLPIYVFPRGEEGFMIWARDIVACICIITLLQQTKGKAWLNELSANAVIQQGSTISFSMFVTHGIVNSAITQPLVSGLLEAGLGQTVVYWIGMLVMFLCVILVSLVIHFLWEQRLYQLITMCISRLSKKTVPNPEQKNKVDR